MINVLFSGNCKVFDGILSCILSIIKRTKSREPFRFYIVTMELTRVKTEYQSITKNQCDFLETIVKKYNIDNKVIRKDVTLLYEKEFSHCPNELTYCSPYTLLRLLADLIEDMPNKILYLDVDILFQRDIDLLYQIDVSDYEYAAARDHYGKYLIHPNYINAGVLLFNLQKMKETGLLRKARELICLKKLMFADQSALYRCTTKKRMLPQRYNDQKFLHKHTVVRHFSKRLFYLPYPHTANIKQWDVSKIHKIFRYYSMDDILYDYIYYKKKYEYESVGGNV